MSFDVTVGPPVLTINRGSTFMVTDRTGEIRPNEELGVFARDTRFVGYYQCTIERAPWTLLTSTATTYYSTRLVYTNPELAALDSAMPNQPTVLERSRGRIPANTIGLVVTRAVGEGIREEFSIVNYGTAPVHFHMEVSLRSDFVDLFDVKAHRFLARGDVETSWAAADDHWDLVSDYRNGDFARRFTYRIVASDSPPQYANGRINWTINLPPGGQWQSRALMLPDLDVAHPLVWDGSIGPQEQELQAWNRASTLVATSNKDVAAAHRQSMEDLAALRLHEHDMPDNQWVPRTGVPWFVTLFGRDSLVVSYQTMAGDAAFAKGALQKLAEFQATERDDWRDAQPGKILHELRRGELAHFHLIPHTPYYGTWDATSLYLIVLHEAWKWTGDQKLLEQFLPTAERCLLWIDQYGDLDADGFQEYKTYSSQGYDNMSWKDAGEAVMYPDGKLVKQPKALCELQGYAYDAKRRMAEVYAALGNADRARELQLEADGLRRAFNERFWLEELGTYAYGLDPDKKPIASVVSNPGHCLWSGIADLDKAARVVRRLLEPDMWSGWGVRTLSAQHAAYNPFFYQNGSVWPHDNAFIAAGFKRYGFAAEANQVAKGIFDATTCFEAYRLPELFAGLDRTDVSFPVQYLGANIPQAWAAASILLLGRTMLGLRADAPANRLYVHPTLPEWLPDLELRQLRVGASLLDFRFWREGDTSRWELLGQQGGTTIGVVEQAEPTP